MQVRSDETPKSANIAFQEQGDREGQPSFPNQTDEWIEMSLYPGHSYALFWLLTLLFAAAGVVSLERLREPVGLKSIHSATIVSRQTRTSSA